MNLNENLNLREVLKDAQGGLRLWSPIFGVCTLKCVDEPTKLFPVKVYVSGDIYAFTEDGKLHVDGECCLFPSREMRDWSKFKSSKPKVERFDPKTLQPFQQVLVRRAGNFVWVCDFFENIDEDNDIYVITSDYPVSFIVPYNDDTKHLIGTTDEAPEYYRYWED